MLTLSKEAKRILGAALVSRMSAIDEATRIARLERELKALKKEAAAKR